MEWERQWRGFRERVPPGWKETHRERCCFDWTGRWLHVMCRSLAAPFVTRRRGSWGHSHQLRTVEQRGGDPSPLGGCQIHWSLSKSTLSLLVLRGELPLVLTEHPDLTWSVLFLSYRCHSNWASQGPEGSVVYTDCALFLFIFRARGREGEREGEKHLCVVASGAPPIGDLAHNPGMCPDWDSN